MLLKKKAFCIHILSLREEVTTTTTLPVSTLQISFPQIEPPFLIQGLSPHPSLVNGPTLASYAHTIAKVPTQGQAVKPQEVVPDSENMSLPAAEKSSRG